MSIENAYFAKDLGWSFTLSLMLSREIIQSLRRGTDYTHRIPQDWFDMITTCRFDRASIYNEYKYDGLIMARRRVLSFRKAAIYWSLWEMAFLNSHATADKQFTLASRFPFESVAGYMDYATISMLLPTTYFCFSFPEAPIIQYGSIRRYALRE